MKKILCLLLALVVCLSLTACDNGLNKEPTTQNPPNNGEVVQPIQPDNDYNAGDDYTGEEKEEIIVTPIEPSGNFDAGEDYGETENEGTVVQPIQPNGNFNGGENYGN